MLLAIRDSFHQKTEDLTSHLYILVTKTTAARIEDALSCLRVRGPYYLTVVFVATIVRYATLTNISSDSSNVRIAILQLYGKTLSSFS